MSADPENSASPSDIAFLGRERSFSLLYFTGDVHGVMPDFLGDCGYLLIADGRYEGPFFDVIDLIGEVEGPDNSIVHKATYRVPGGTVLLDPEMVIGSLYESKIVQLCSEHRVDALVAIWERYSETIIGRYLTAGGVRTDFAVMQGSFQEPPLNPPPDLPGEAGPGSLRAFLARAGAPISAIFGTVSTRVFKLDESGKPR